jgi:hypothetical protein
MAQAKCEKTSPQFKMNYFGMQLKRTWRVFCVMLIAGQALTKSGRWIFWAVWVVLNFDFGVSSGRAGGSQ